MPATNLTLPYDIETRLDRLCERVGRAKNELIIDAIYEYLDDLEDYYIATERLADIRAGREKTIPLEEVESMLDLEN